MSQAPMMPVFPDALLGDTLDLSAEQFGAYCLILFATWRNNGQALPDDPSRLARICRVERRHWSRNIRPALIRFFDLAEQTWRQKRLEKEWLWCAKRAGVSRRNGLHGGRPKSPKDNNTQNPAGSSQVTRKEPALTLIVDTSPNGAVSPYTDRLKSLSPSNGVRDAEIEFSSIYAIYPRHVGRGAALKAFIRARQTVDLTTLQHAVERFAQQRAGEDPRYTPHMATWLNAQRWADDEDNPQDEDNPHDNAAREAARKAAIEDALHELKRTNSQIRETH
jgi:uncharacterized protein YdaU (DUF1376 family)